MVRENSVHPTEASRDVSETETHPATPAEVESAVCCGGGDEAHSCSPTPGGGEQRPGPLDGCPTPLAWQQVLDAFRQQSTSWEVRREGYTLRGRTWGNGPPLYLLCGMGGTSESYCLVVYLLRELFRCTVFDYPGTLEPIRPSRRVTLDSLRDDLLAVADFQGDRQFEIFASSFGGLVALNSLQAVPDRITKAVLQGGFAHRRLSVAERAIAKLGRILPGRLKSLPGARAIQEQNHRRWFPPLDQTRWQFFLDDAAQVPLKTLAHRGRMIRDTDLRPELASIQPPILLIQCEGDGLVTRDCHAALASGLPHAQTAWMHSAGHLPHLTSPHRLAKFLRDFLLTPTQGAVEVC